MSNSSLPKKNMTTKKTFETSTVRELAKYFDTTIPGWHRFITKPINMLDVAACVLGQYGSYHNATYAEMRRKLFPTYCPWTSPNAKKNAYRSLLSDRCFNADWQREVEKRKATDTVKTPVAENGTFEWAMQQLKDGKTVMHDSNILIPATDGKVPAGFKFTYEEVNSKNWKLTKLTLADIKVGEKFKCLHQTFLKVLYNGDAIFLNIGANMAVSLTYLSQALKSANVEIERV